METLIAIFVVLFAGLGVLSGFYLLFGQLIWGIIDVSVSDRHSGGTKAAIILLTFLLLGPVMTFFYACFGSHSRVLRRTTVGAFIVFCVCGAGILALAGVHGATQKKLHDIIGRDGATAGAPADTVGADALVIDTFRAVNYVPTSSHKWSVSISDFDLSGAVRDSSIAVTVPSIYPLNQIAIDPATGRTYGITTHVFGYIVPATGHFVEIERDPGVPELSWPSAIAWDEANARVVVVGRNAAYAYDPKTGAWEPRPGFAKLGLVSLTRAPEERVFYGLVSEFGRDVVDAIVRVDENGAVLSAIQLNREFTKSEVPDNRVQLRVSRGHLVILISPHYRRENGRDVRVGQQIYVVDPGTGDIALVRP
jgi:hypothetical protein